MLFLTSLFLALLPLLGILWILISGRPTTVDGLFMSLILLAISATLGGNAFFEFRRWKSFGFPWTFPKRQALMVMATGQIQRGKVESVEFFESNVGQPNKSIVMLSDRGSPRQMLVFEGDMRNALPTGLKVEITLRKMTGYNVLVNVSYS